MGLRRWLTRGPSMALPSTVQPELVSESMKRARGRRGRSEEHTSELQSLRHLVCRLLLEKKKTEVQNPIEHALPVRFLQLCATRLDVRISEQKLQRARLILTYGIWRCIDNEFYFLLKTSM